MAVTDWAEGQAPDKQRSPAGGPGGSRVRARQAISKFDASWLLPAVIVVLIGYLTVYPIGMMISDSLHIDGRFGLDHYTAILSSGPSLRLIRNSLIFAVGASVFGTATGAVLAWLVERTNMPARRLFFTAALVPLIIPGALSTFSWVLLLSPRVGLINIGIQNITGIESGPINVFSMPGMIFVEGLHLSSLAFLLIAGALRSMDASLEEAASSSGAGTLKVASRITMPLLMPALISTLLLGFIRAVEGFEVPGMLGLPGRVPVLASQIYLALKTFPINMGVVGTYSTLLFIIGGISVVIYLRVFSRGGFTTVSGKGYRPRVIDLGRYRFAALAFATAYVTILFVLPALVMVWASLIPFYAAPSGESIRRVSLSNYSALLDNPIAIESAKHSLILAVGAATIVVVLTAVCAWITVRSRVKGRQLLDVAAFLPIAIPGLVLGVAMVDLYAGFPLKIYGTIFVLIIAFVIKFMPYGMRANASSIMQIHPELEEAAAASGANWFRTFTKVILPLLRPGLFVGWVYIFIVATRELSAAIILASPRNVPLAVLIYDLYSNGQYTVLSALGVVMVVGLSLLVLLFQRLGGRPTVH